MKSVNRLSLVAIVFVAFFLTIGAFISDLHAEEKIHSFHSDITVNRDGTLTITEAITVSVENVQIKHGIYRDFPTSYRDRLGRIKTVPFDVISATRDGDPERWFIKKLKNGVRVYMGNRSVTIPRGKYTYALTYRTDHQLGFFESHDEIYWNVNGNDWPFRMEKVSARVRLPQEVPPDSILVDGFTGAYGSKGKDFDIYLDENGSVNFETTRAFRKKEGLTIVVTWSPGFIARPTLRESVFLFTRQNAEMVVGGGGLIVLLLYYLVAWFILGRDPATGTIVPLFEPPGDITPGAIRYLNRMKYDHHAFASDIISLAVKGFIRIRDEGKNKVALEKLGSIDEFPLVEVERNLALELFPDEGRVLELNKENSETLFQAYQSHYKRMKKNYLGGTLMANKGYVFFGLALTMAIMVFIGTQGRLTLSLGNTRAVPSFLFLWFILLHICIFMESLRRRILFLGSIIMFFMSVILIRSLDSFNGFSWMFSISWDFFALLFLFSATNWIFYQLMKAPTKTGRKLMDRIEGFKMYLSTAEEHRLQSLHPPEKTPELFEKYLPFALALDVDQKWSKKFSGVLASAKEEGGYYYPNWYTGSSWNRTSPDRFSSSLGRSMTTAVVASTAAPGSSSGLGGFAGGGGGGGGGGGW